ncbi:MAG: hypothetical protein NTY02_06175 [Acidobacteria bacterium]|nr:hypothetical protein [Acidobacteriota bacterium]
MATELVTRLQQTFEKLGSGDSACAASEELGDLTRDAEGALNTGQLTPAFHARLKRLLLIVRLSTYSDPGGLLAPALLPFANKELTAFVRDATGKAFNPKGPVSEQIGMVADATATEMTSLQAAAKQLK